jgi:hypothetical protein
MLGVLSCFLTSVPAIAAPQTIVAQTSTAGTLTGTVKSANGAPLRNAIVTSVGATTATATTDASGNFTLSLPPGL